MSETAAETLVERIRQALHVVIDPELGYNIVDLGLIYDVAVDDGGTAHITMTTTTRGCPATSFLADGARDAVAAVPGVQSADVMLTYDPPWRPQMMSAAAKANLGVASGGGW